jgi:hypothetical protein
MSPDAGRQFSRTLIFMHGAWASPGRCGNGPGFPSLAPNRAFDNHRSSLSIKERVRNRFGSRRVARRHLFARRNNVEALIARGAGMRKEKRMGAIAGAGLAVVLIALPVLPARAEAPASSFVTVAQLRDDCMALHRAENGRASLTDTTLASICTGYVLGFSDGMVTQAVATGQRPSCTAYSQTADQLAAVFIAWADRHRERLQGPAGTGVFAALQDAGLCSPPRR